ncbi:MAG TPA: SprT-like domain-containing protein [Vicinamibacterales bacterium]|nr:SprT-like domain-containing protein [Vicinamibacterales bacterium]
MNRNFSVCAAVVTALSTCLACGGSPRAEPRRRVVAADQVRMDDLMRQNETRASEPDLADAYAIVNAQYFDNRLPPVRIRWEEGLDAIGPMIAENFRLEGLTNGKVILLHPALAREPRQLRAVLCHEMVHVSLRETSGAHGPEFQARLRSLAERGAFVGVVATDEEKAELKTALERTTRRLAGELHELRQLQSRLDAEAPSMTREALQDRIWDFNRRVRQHNEDVDAFNRDIERYNLMITYPDGLDRERLEGRAIVTPAG